MKELITNSQKREIEELAVEHHAALIAMGADLYRQGYNKGYTKGAIAGMVGVTVGFVILKVKRELKKSKEQDQ